MRVLVAAALIALSVAVSFAFSALDSGFGFGSSAPEVQIASIQGATPFNARNAAPIDKQNANIKPPRGRGGDDSCRWANDNECDDPDIGTGACRMGTDYSDCRALREGENDSCRWARDGECDEPNIGTGACVQATDRTDCGALANLRNQTDRCATAFNGVCEEPGRGNGCEARTDRSDCIGRQRPMTINDHFFGRDDRVRVNARELPWRFMGRFTNSNGEACTATLIARDVLVTAAHCIHNDNGVDALGTFRAEDGGAEARSVAYLVNPSFNYRRFTTTDEIDGMDWALIRLDQPLGDRLGFAGIRDISALQTATARATDLYQAGYSWDTGDTLSANVACHLIEFYRDGTFAHQCDTTRGDSGSAFLVRNGQSFDVIGVDSNYRTEPGQPAINIAVGARQFRTQVADFVAGRTGIAVNSGGKPKRD